MLINFSLFNFHLLFIVRLTSISVSIFRSYNFICKANLLLIFIVLHLTFDEIMCFAQFDLKKRKVFLTECLLLGPLITKHQG